MSYVLFIVDRDFVSVSTYSTFAAAESAYYTAVAKVAFGMCAGDAPGRVIYQMG